MIDISPGEKVNYNTGYVNLSGTGSTYFTDTGINLFFRVWPEENIKLIS
jgi:hypothetical protein